MEWELRHVEDVEAVLDDSDLYVVINRIELGKTREIKVRLDLMEKRPGDSDGDRPAMSWLGSAIAVRKAIARHLEYGYGIRHPSLEHMTYIGYELLRAETDPNYVQD